MQIKTLKRLLVVLAGTVLVALTMLLVLSGYMVDWTGLGDFTSPSGDFERRKTLWDWMELVLIPIALFFLALYFSGLEKRRAEAQKKIQREQTSIEQQDQILQTYLDRMQGLVLEKDLLSSQEGTSLANFARTLTLVTLTRLSAGHKTVVLQFLDEIGLIQNHDRKGLIISLHGADLAGVGLPLGLGFADLEGADLGGADFRGAKLDFPNFRNANLKNTVLEDASLIGADLRGTNLEIALLKGANLFGAQFDETTILPNGKTWGNTDMTMFGAVLRQPYSEEELNETRVELRIDEV